VSGADVQLATFERGKGERLAILWREYEGFHFVDIRVQFEKDGQWLPTKKGITVKLREIFGVFDAIAKGCELAKVVRK
jgi:transcriptional coactivator p15 (PC4)